MSCKLISVTHPVIPECETAEDLIAYIARVSNPANQVNKETSSKLLKYLIKNNHWSPFEQVSLTIEIVTTRDIGRQILRHRSFVFQEFSQRYAEATEFHDGREARLQDNKNRQNSIETDDGDLQRWWNTWQNYVKGESEKIYKLALQRGIAKEQARAVLPEGLTMSRMYMTGNLRNWIHYCQLRTGNGTQKEHAEIAKACWDIVKEEFPSLEDLFDNDC
jgi:thymidylate synthase (FAD)